MSVGLDAINSNVTGNVICFEILLLKGSKDFL